MARDYLSFPKKDASSSKRGSVKDSDRTTRIYACATMWHETEDEMLEMLKSIFRWVILITFLLIRLIVQGGLRLLKETSRPEVLWRG